MNIESLFEAFIDFKAKKIWIFGAKIHIVGQRIKIGFPNETILGDFQTLWAF